MSRDTRTSSGTAIPQNNRGGKGKNRNSQRDAERERQQWEREREQELQREREQEREQAFERERALERERERAFAERKGKPRNIVDLASLNTRHESPRSKPSNVHSAANTPARVLDSISSEDGSDSEPETPSFARGPPAAPPNRAGPSLGPIPSIYDDVAGVIDALNNIIVRTSDGSYLHPQVEGAIGMANNAARAAIEESARRAQESIGNVLRTLGTPAAPQRGPPNVGAATQRSGNMMQPTAAPLHGEGSNFRPRATSTGQPLPWSMLPDQDGHKKTYTPPLFGAPPKEEPPFKAGPGPDSRIPPFVPPPIPPPFPVQATPGRTPNQPLRGLFSSTPKPEQQMPRPAAHERTAFTGSRFHPAVGPQIHTRPTEAVVRGVQPVNAASETARISEEQAALQSEKERLEAARRLYKQEKANFRAQKEAEKLERAERKARREKG